VAPMQRYLSAIYLAPSILPFDLHLQAVQEGLTYDDGVIRVTAVGNTHMTANFMYDRLRTECPELTLESYSFGVEVEGHRFVFSGDITSLSDLDPLLPGADLVITEVAHYDPQDVGPHFRDLPVRQVILTHIHPGLEERVASLVGQWADPRIQIAYDGMRLALGPS